MTSTPRPRHARRRPKRRAARRRRATAAALVALLALVAAAAAVRLSSDDTRASADERRAAGGSATTTASSDREPRPASDSRSETDADPGEPRRAAPQTRRAIDLPPGSKPIDGPVPVLMYHVINDPPAGAPNPSLYVPREEFEEQVAALHSAGYSGVTLDEVWRSWKNGAKLPPKPIVLSFDDGAVSVHTNGFQVLRKRRWPAVLNLELKVLDLEWGLKPRMVEEMVEAGWEVDSHTISHADLVTLGAAELERQVSRSRSELRRLFGVPANFIAYPSGSYDQRVIDAVRRAGYLGATTVESGLADQSEPYSMNRVRIDRGDGAAGMWSRLSQFGPAP